MGRKRKEDTTTTDAVEEKIVDDNSNSNKVAAWLKREAQSKKFKGHVQMSLASDINTTYTLRRRTGIMGLDLALGGGFHSGGGVQIYGPESVGKTFLTFKVGSELQKEYGNNAAIFIYSTEIRPDKGFARCAGMCVGYSNQEIEEFDIIRQSQGFPPFTAEERLDLKKQIGEVVISTAENAEMGLEGVLSAVESRLFQLVIIESLGALLPKSVDEGDLDDGHYGGSSRAVTNFQNKLYKYFMMYDDSGTTNPVTIIGINQARAIIGGGPRGPKMKPAADAYAWKHGQLASVELTRGSDIKNTDDAVIGKEVRWKLTKGKAGTHDGKKGKFNYYHVNQTEPVFWKDYQEVWLGGVDTVTDMVETGKEIGIIEASGSWITWEEEDKVIVRCQGIENFAKKLIEDEELVEKFKNSCIKKSGLLVRYK